MITSISRDHTELLGETLPEIAGEKAGIIKPDVPVVMAPQRPEVEEVISSIARQRGSDMVNVGREVVWRSLAHGEWGQKLLVRDFEKEYRVSMPLHRRPPAGERCHGHNGFERTAEKRDGDISDSDIVDGFADMSLAGPDGGAGASAACHRGWGAQRGLGAEAKGGAHEVLRVQKGSPGGRCVGGQERVQDIASELVPLAPTVILTKSRHMRAADPHAIADAFRRPDIIVETTESVKEALQRARELASEEDLVCVTGSLFVVGEAIEAVKRVPVEIY